ncbi:MAG: glycosyltransferase [Bacteroidales bacterium]|nr:glycosyltransferase [Bacteroidales bacterium]
METKLDVISVIVPIYKVERYLVRCIESILHQTYPKLEIILVDDGSPDRCGIICDEYALKDERIKVVHKENGGAAEARNVGLDMASGVYIGFVDPDDYIHPVMYEHLLNNILLYKADIALCYYRAVNETDPVLYEDHALIGTVAVFDNESALRKLLDDDHGNFVVVWNKLYRRELFDNLRHPIGRTREDEFMAYHVLFRSQKVVFLKQHLYYYLQRTGSFMRNKNLQDELNFSEVQEERVVFLEENNLPLLSLMALKFYCIWLTSTLFQFRNKAESREFCEIINVKKKHYIGILLKKHSLSIHSKLMFRWSKKACLFPGYLAYRRIYRLDWLSGFIKKLYQ